MTGDLRILIVPLGAIEKVQSILRRTLSNASPIGTPVTFSDTGLAISAATVLVSKLSL